MKTDTRTKAQSPGLESIQRFPDWYVAPGSLENEYFLIVAGFQAKQETLKRDVETWSEVQP